MNTSSDRCSICAGRLVLSPLPGYRRCGVCGHSAHLAPGTGGPVTNAAPRTQAASQATRLQRAQIKVVADRAHDAVRVVDIGCGDGSYLFALRQALGDRLTSCVGVEVDPTSISQATSVYQVDVVPDIAAVPGPVDIATAWHSFEHFPIDSLAAALATLRDQLTRPNGSILVSVPNGSSLQQRAFRTRWAFHDDPHHHSVFTAESLDRLMTSCGFERDRAAWVPLYGWFSAVQSALNLFIRPHNALYYALKRERDSLSRKSLLLHVAVAPLAVVVALPFALAELRPKRAASLNTWYRVS